MSKETRHMQVTMAAASPAQLEAMYNFFNLLELLYDNKYGFNDSTPDDMEDGFPEAWIKQAKYLYEKQQGDMEAYEDQWKHELVKFAFGDFSISAGWRRVIGGFESLFETFCVKDHDTLTYDTDHLVQLIEQAENCTITRTPKEPTNEQQ